MNIKFDLKGEKQLLRAIDSFRPARQRLVARKALRPAAASINRAAKAAVPSTLDTQDRRDIKRGIKRRRKTYLKGGVVIEAIGPQYDFKDTSDGVSAGYKAEQVEFGDPANGVPAQPFMRQVLPSKRQEVMRQITEAAKNAVRVEAERMKAKSGGRS